MTDLERPSFLTNSHLIYLDELRESGVTNMLGAASFLEREFALPRERASKILSYWMQTFPRHEPTPA